MQFLNLIFNEIELNFISHRPHTTHVNYCGELFVRRTLLLFITQYIDELFLNVRQFLFSFLFYLFHSCVVYKFIFIFSVLPR
jgi:hypothetical protein